MEVEDLLEIVIDMCYEVIDELVDYYIFVCSYVDQWDVQGFYVGVIEKIGVDVFVIIWCEEDGVDDFDICECLCEVSDVLMVEKVEVFGLNVMCQVEKQIFLNIIDIKWCEYFLCFEYLCLVVGFCGYVQCDLLNEYKIEVF